MPGDLLDTKLFQGVVLAAFSQTAAAFYVIIASSFIAVAEQYQVITGCKISLHKIRFEERVVLIPPPPPLSNMLRVLRVRNWLFAVCTHMCATYKE